MADSSDTSRAEAADLPVLDYDLSCATCSYNLRGLDVQGSCPECGQSISYTLEKNKLQRADPFWLQRISMGIGGITVTIAAITFIATLHLLNLINLRFVQPSGLQYAQYGVTITHWFLIFYLFSSGETPSRSPLPTDAVRLPLRIFSGFYLLLVALPLQSGSSIALYKAHDALVAVVAIVASVFLTLFLVRLVWAMGAGYLIRHLWISFALSSIGALLYLWRTVTNDFSSSVFYAGRVGAAISAAYGLWVCLTLRRLILETLHLALMNNSHLSTVNAMRAHSALPDPASLK